MSCSVSSLSKYTSRPSPPRPANSAGCRGQIHVGNDGKDWISKPAVNGVYRWVKVGGGSPTTTRKRTSNRRKSTKRTSNRRKSTKRKSTKRKSTKRKSTKRKSTKRKSTKRK
jgi:hypothetical protein